MGGTRNSSHRNAGSKGKRWARIRNIARLRIGMGGGRKRRWVLSLLHKGELVETYAKANSEFSAQVRWAVLTTLTDPDDLALFPDFLTPYWGRH